MTWENIKALPIQFWLSLIVTLCSGTAGSAIVAQITDLAGGTTAKTVAAIFGLLATIAGVLLTVLSTQYSITKTVSNMPGVDPVQLNTNATSALMSLGADTSPAASKVLAPHP